MFRFLKYIVRLKTKTTTSADIVRRRGREVCGGEDAKTHNQTTHLTPAPEGSQVGTTGNVDVEK